MGIPGALAGLPARSERLPILTSNPELAKAHELGSSVGLFYLESAMSFFVLFFFFFSFFFNIEDKYKMERVPYKPSFAFF